MLENTNEKILNLQEDLKNCEECSHNLKNCEYSTHGFLGTHLLPRNENGICKSLLKKEREEKS